MTRPMPGPPDKSTHDRHKRRGIIHRSCPWCGPFCAPSKHLTDAECAAEYWRAGWAADHDFHDEREADEASTWHRFATHPHAFKENHNDRP